VFHSQGAESVTVKPVKPKVADEITKTLGY
jgi:hypothetical protein